MDVAADCLKLLTWAIGNNDKWSSDDFWQRYVKTARALSKKYGDTEYIASLIAIVNDLLEKLNGQQDSRKQVLYERR